MLAKVSGQGAKHESARLPIGPATSDHVSGNEIAPLEQQLQMESQGSAVNQMPQYDFIGPEDYPLDFGDLEPFNNVLDDPGNLDWVCSLKQNRTLQYTKGMPEFYRPISVKSQGRPRRPQLDRKKNR